MVNIEPSFNVDVALTLWPKRFEIVLTIYKPIPLDFSLILPL